jgi:hypothetical protein
MNDRNAPATRGDIHDLRTKIDGLSTEPSEKIEILRSEVHHYHNDRVKRLDDRQAKLLNAFYGVTQSIRERFKAKDDMESGLKKRLTLVEERLMDLERKVNFPNHPQ